MFAIFLSVQLYRRISDKKTAGIYLGWFFIMYASDFIEITIYGIPSDFSALL